MKNEMTSSGIGEDLIRAFVQLTASEMHLKTLYEKTVAEMENGIVDMSDEKTRDSQIEKANAYLEDLERIADIRRQTMRYVFDLFEGGDKDVWCMVKHLGVANMQIFEAYMNSDNDAELLQMAIESNGVFTSYVTRFLGMEITDCAACLSEALKGEDSGNSKAPKR